MSATSKGLCSLSFVLAISAAAWAAEPASLPFLSPVFGDHMVLQQGKPNRIWGWTSSGAAVHVQVAGQESRAVAGKDGRWEVPFKPPAPGGPYTVRITGPQTVELQDVLCGDVWLCGGQSNMELPLGRARNGEAEIAAANHPRIRFFTVKSHPAYTPARLVQGTWKVCSPKSVTEEDGFSAVAYFFGRKVQSETGMPVGLIQDCLGGTPAEAWASPEKLRSLKEFDAGLDELQRRHAQGGPEYGNYIMHWYDEFDIGQKGKAWAAPDLDESGWRRVTIPGGFAELSVSDTPSLCYFRKEFTLPGPLPAGRTSLRLGVIEKMDTTWLNGRWVGASAWVENPRVYFIPVGVLQPGRNVVTVRVFKLQPQGGFKSKPGELKLVLGDKTEIPLGGEWKGKLSVDARPPHPLPLGFENWPVMPSVLYQGMLAPLSPLGLTGAIWYQGEANASRAAQYRTLLPAMIADWRKLFGQGDFPFYIVSLPAFMAYRDTPGEDGWAELREAQALTAQRVPNCGLAVTIDTGDPNNIHPQEKQVVGERLALLALAKHYGKSVVCAGPAFVAMKRLPGALELHFEHTDGGLLAKSGKPAEFALAGSDRKWVWAEAKIVGDTVVVSSPKVAEPVAVRYAWQANPVATLFNGAGLPATPFRTDDWSKDTRSAAR